MLKKILAIMALTAWLPGGAFAANLVAHYTFDDGTAADSSGNSYNGTLVGSGVSFSGGYATFSGNGKIDCGFAEKTALCTPVNGTFRDISVACWMRTTSGGANGDMVTRCTDHYNNSYWVGMTGNGANIHTEVPYVANLEYGPVNDGNWHFIVMTYKAAPGNQGGGLTLYVDGANQGFASQYSWGRWDNTSDWHLMIGASQESFWNQYQGDLDDVRIYQGVLSDTEMLRLYNKLTPTLLTVTGITADSKMYDGTTAATIHVGAATLVGVAPGDNVTLDTTLATGVFQDKNAGTNKTVTVTGLALTGADAWKYDLALVTATANISSVPITITADPQSKVVGDPDPVLTYQVTSGSIVAGDSLIGNIVQPAGSNYVAWEGETASYVNGVPTTWGAANDPLASGGAALVAGGTSFSGDPPSSIASWKLIFNTPGSYNLYVRYWCNPPGSTANNSYRNPASFGDSPTFLTSAANSVAGPTDYTVIPEAGSFVVNPGDVGSPLTFKVGTREAGFYLDRLVLSTNSSLSSAGFAALLNTPAGLTRVPGEAVGTYAIQRGTLTGGGNYVITFVGANLTITARVLVLVHATGIVANNKVYDGTQNAVLDASHAALTGVLPGDLVSLDASGAVGLFDNMNVGTNKNVTISGLALTGADAYKYELVQPIYTNANITPLLITVTADPETKMEGAADPALTYQITSGGLLTGDNFTGGLTRSPGEAAGTYPIGLGTLAEPNYAITFVGSSLTITPAILVAHYTFDDGTAADSSGNGYDGTLVGSGVTIGNGYATFSGNGKIDCGFAEQTAMCTPANGVFRNLTVALKMRTTGGGANGDMVTRCTDHYNNSYWVGMTGNGASIHTEATYVANVEWGPVNDGQWHAVVMTYKAASGNQGGGVTLFVDGDKKGFNSQYSWGRWDNTTDWHLMLGASQETFWNQYQGDLDDVRIYQGNLADSEIKALYAPLQITNTVLHGANLLLSGANGTAGAQFRVLSSTNVVAPRGTWLPAVTNSFDTNGNFSVSIPLVPGEQKRFYQISVP